MRNVNKNERKKRNENRRREKRLKNTEKKRKGMRIKKRDEKRKISMSTEEAALCKGGKTVWRERVAMRVVPSGSLRVQSSPVQSRPLQCGVSRGMGAAEERKATGRCSHAVDRSGASSKDSRPA